MNPVESHKSPRSRSFPLLIGLLLALLAPGAQAIPRSDLRSGDVILISLPCRLCALIEDEDDSPYSHIGVILEDPAGIRVLDSFRKVASTPLDAFLKLARRGSRPVILRPRASDSGDLNLDPGALSRSFRSSFEGLSYDSDYLWDNFDGSGEKLYCSEFVAKFLNPFLPVPVSPKPMHFRVRREEWIRHFRGTPPDGMPGLSPGDFARSAAFRNLGELE